MVWNTNHPLAAGILREAEARGIAVPSVEGVRTIAGVGLAGKYEGNEIEVVNAAYLDKQGVAYDVEAFRALSEEGNSISFLLENEKAVGMVAQGDRIKKNAKTMVEALKKQGVVPVMLTGDNEAAARSVARQLGIADVHAALLPDDKEKIIRQYEEQGKVVMMVGDGINDAPSLARADIGIAIGAGTDVAIDSADVVLVRSDPADILKFLTPARRTSRKMVQNLWWGAGYNIVAIPLAAGVLAPIGILLDPAVGAALMSVSTVVVALNALTLRLKDK
ncbi:MAG: HAD-IC family P-type ATPase [Christensenella sp.]|uniref:HAD-IC family P-type ATPase n=1 Tax=Christensenella sp. TaxID=1935934 RepID=UPI002B1EAEC8|nr:HAD-IC family P-type ATPase [Christensenella sp.]MEA5001905.1 HAD-IC family P-type ATPase [Christensenella sp.]